MFFGTLELHSRSNILSLGVNWSDPRTSSTTNHKFYKTLGRLHSPWCKHPPFIWGLSRWTNAEGTHLYGRIPSLPPNKKWPSFPLPQHPPQHPTPHHTTPLHFTRSWTAAEHASPRANRSQKQHARSSSRLHTWWAPDPPPPPLSPTYSSLQNPGTHSEDPAPKQNKTKQTNHTTPNAKGNQHPCRLGGLTGASPFHPFPVLFHSVPFRLGLRLAAGVYPGHLDSSALNM